jgi:hypothetical protein
VELVEPDDVLPEGVEIAIQHFLTVPHCAEVGEAMQTKGDAHNIIKITKDEKGALHQQLIDTQNSILTPYLKTDKLQKKPLCFITTTSFLTNPFLWGAEKAECSHTSLKEIIVTQNNDLCCHEPMALALYAMCESAKDRFNALIQKRGHSPTVATTEQNIEKCEKATYDISVKILERTQFPTVHKISHLDLCKYNGVKQLGGSIQGSFGCCTEHQHCNEHRQIFIETKDMSNGMQVAQHRTQCAM